MWRTAVSPGSASSPARKPSSTMSRPTQGPRLDDLPGRDSVGAGDTVRKPPLQLFALLFGQRGLLHRPSHAIAEPINSEFLQRRRHGDNQRGPGNLRTITRRPSPEQGPPPDPPAA